MYPVSVYLWLKAFHIISMVCWFAGLFYLPRLFVYHAELGPNAYSNPEQKSFYALFCKMETKLFWFIMTPSAVLTIVFGLGLIYIAPTGVYSQAGWLHVKLLLVLGLLYYHHLCARYLKRFKQHTNTKSGRFFRYFNEVPSVLLVLIVSLAVTKLF